MSDIPEVQSVGLISLIMRVWCPHCGFKMTRGEASIGKTLKCHNCEGQFKLPNALLVTTKADEATPEQAEAFLRDNGVTQPNPDWVRRQSELEKTHGTPGAGRLARDPYPEHHKPGCPFDSDPAFYTTDMVCTCKPKSKGGGYVH